MQKEVIMFEKTIALSVMMLAAMVFAGTTTTKTDSPTTKATVKTTAPAPKAKVVTAKTDTVFVSLQDVLATEQGKALKGATFYMKGDSHAAVAKTLGKAQASEKVKNAADANASCEAAVVKALASMQKKAQKADAVIDLESLSGKKASSDSTKLECFVGPKTTTVSLSGESVTFKK